MKKLEKTGKQLDLSKYEVSEQFVIYKMGDYDFDENLDFGGKEGVYIFTHREMTSRLSTSYQREIYHHTPLYCGMTTNFNKRFNNHFKSDDLMKSNCNRISIHFCGDNENPAELEGKILSLIKFTFNIEGNDNPKYKENIKFEEV
ncbi:MAG: GIY-YIG nuclease family protein [Bacteroidales bacterium]|nr:GIY-YIG nuclease family protein [Bacteroidales bacterium]